MEHYVTIFDSGFLPQGMALAQSLSEHAGDHVLWVVAVDQEAERALAQLALPNVRVLPLAQVETAPLLAVKGGRTRAEYCWTLTPFASRFVFERDPGIERVTYLDADLWLLRSPQPIFDELERGGKTVLITEHAYAQQYDSSRKTSGTYCVQFLTFTRAGEPVRKWWEERCLEWCFARYENGKFGDQKYLDDWPERFPEHVHVLAHRGWALAPWNATRFPAGDAIFYHFQGLRLISPRWISIGAYPVPQGVVREIYRPYMREIRAAVRKLTDVAALPFKQRDLRGALKLFGYRTAFRLKSAWMKR
jgi:hypothetical protein